MPCAPAWTSSTTTTRIRFPRAERGSYAFSSLRDLPAGTYNNAGFSQTFGEMEVAQGNANAGVYVQDEWSVDDRPDRQPGAPL